MESGSFNSARPAVPGKPPAGAHNTPVPAPAQRQEVVQATPNLAAKFPEHRTISPRIHHENGAVVPSDARATEERSAVLRSSPSVITSKPAMRDHFNRPNEPRTGSE